MSSHELQGQVVDCCASMGLSYIHNEHKKHLLCFSGHWGTIVSTTRICNMLQWTLGDNS